MIVYSPSGVAEEGLFGLSYQELREEYHRFCSMSSKEFRAELPAALHLACVIGWVKELGPEATIGDQGIVHELVHLLHHGESTTPLKKIRRQFRALLELA